MTAFSCIRFEQLLQHRAAGLSTADALLLEEHLAGCKACTQQAVWLQRMSAALNERDVLPSAAALDHAISAALLDARATTTPNHARVTMPRPALAFALAIAAVAMLGLAWRANRPLGGAERVATSDRVLSGTVEVDGRSQAKGSLLPTTTSLHSVAGARLALAHAVAELRPDTRVRWQRDRHALQLEAGSVVADVDPTAHQRFVVTTSRFRVIVLGTRFEVSLDAVSVTRGHVRVVALDGRELASLQAGQRFTVSAPVADVRSPSATDAGSNASAVEGAAPHATRTTAAVSSTAHSDADALLAQARAELASKHVAAAKRTLEAALALDLAANARAEALSLRAECALVAGDRSAAVSGYLRVADAFARLPAGETALFAAARIDAERGRDVAAKRWLDRYLRQYPHGRFVSEAEARLRALAARSGQR